MSAVTHQYQDKDSKRGNANLLRLLPSEVRITVFQYTVDDAEDFKTPSIVVVLRSDQTLYDEVLEVYYARKHMRLRKFSVRSSKNKSLNPLDPTIINMIKKVWITFEQAWNEDDFDDMRMGLFRAILFPMDFRSKLFLFNNIQDLRLDFGDICSDALSQTVKLWIQWFPSLRRIQVDSRTFSIIAGQDYEVEFLETVFILDMNEHLQVPGRPVSVSPYTWFTVPWFWEAKDGKRLQWKLEGGTSRAEHDR